mmetsp:Transcript_7406/g.11754  ORF Transcript_7406/g.11754 Transcript_7406/m.11754 type:complete len:458 (+) Transcript_7406:322-1695(+)
MLMVPQQVNPAKGFQAASINLGKQPRARSSQPTNTTMRPPAAINFRSNSSKLGPRRRRGSGVVLRLLQQLYALVQRRHNLRLGDAEARRGRDVHGAVRADGRVLAAQPAHAQAQRLGHRLGLRVRAVGRQLGQRNVHAGAHACADVRRAAGDHPHLVALGAAALDELLHHVHGRLQPVKDGVQQGALLHAHDAQVVLLADPDDEPLVLAHVAAAAVGPVRGDARRGQVRVRGHVLEHDVVLDQLVVGRLVDEVRVVRGDAHVAAAELGLGLERGEDGAHGQLQLAALLAGHRGRQREAVQVAPCAHAHGERRQAQLGQVQHARGGQALHALQRPVVHVAGRAQVNLVVLLQRRFEEGLQLVVVVRLVRVAAHLRVRVVDARGAALQQPGLQAVVQAVVVCLVERGRHDVVRVGPLDFQDAGHQLLVARLGLVFLLLQQLQAPVERGQDLRLRDAEAR